MIQERLAEFIVVCRQTINAIARVFGASIEDVFFCEPEPEGKHALADGVEIEIT